MFYFYFIKIRHNLEIGQLLFFSDPHIIYIKLSLKNAHLKKTFFYNLLLILHAYIYYNIINIFLTINYGMWQIAICAQPGRPGGSLTCGQRRPGFLPVVVFLAASHRNSVHRNLTASRWPPCCGCSYMLRLPAVLGRLHRVPYT